MTLEEQQFVVEILNDVHDRSAFASGVETLDTYLLRQARQDRERTLAAVYILSLDRRTIAGFYTLSASSITAAHLPGQHGRKLPRFPIPVTLLGRMAVHTDFQGQGLGKLLLFDAFLKAKTGASGIASWAVIVDATEAVRDFYLRYRFTAFPNRPERLYLPMREIEKLPL